VSRALVATALCLAVGASSGCRQAPRPAAAPVYAPFYGAAPALVEARGTLKGDYDWAARSTTTEEATIRWREFLRAHAPKDGEYEDAFQRNYVRAAQYELMRAEYLRGRAGEGDELLRDLEDVRGR
jgi:hypothetical protein